VRPRRLDFPSERHDQQRRTLAQALRRCEDLTSEGAFDPMTRDALTHKILAAKRLKGLTWKAIVAEIGGGSAVYLTAGLMGQMKLRPDQAERAVKLFELDEDENACCKRSLIAARCRL
jgi:hypothetical protein